MSPSRSSALAALSGITALTAVTLPAAQPSASASQLRAAREQPQELSLRLGDYPGEAATEMGNYRIEQQAYAAGSSSQEWWPRQITDNIFQFRSVAADTLCMTITGQGDGSPVELGRCDATTSYQQWKMVRHSVGFRIVSANNGKCLTVRGRVGRGNVLDLWPCNIYSSASQTWLPVWQIPRPEAHHHGEVL